MYGIYMARVVGFFLLLLFFKYKVIHLRKTQNHVWEEVYTRKEK